MDDYNKLNSPRDAKRLRVSPKANDNSDSESSLDLSNLPTLQPPTRLPSFQNPQAPQVQAVLQSSEGQQTFPISTTLTPKMSAMLPTCSASVTSVLKIRSEVNAAPNCSIILPPRAQSLPTSLYDLPNLNSLATPVGPGTLADDSTSPNPAQIEPGISTVPEISAAPNYGILLQPRAQSLPASIFDLPDWSSLASSVNPEILAANSTSPNLMQLEDDISTALQPDSSRNSREVSANNPASTSLLEVRRETIAVLNDDVPEIPSGVSAANSISTGIPKVSSEILDLLNAASIPLIPVQSQSQIDPQLHPHPYTTKAEPTVDYLGEQAEQEMAGQEAWEQEKKQELARSWERARVEGESRLEGIDELEKQQYEKEITAWRSIRLKKWIVWEKFRVLNLLMEELQIGFSEAQDVMDCMEEERREEAMRVQQAMEEEEREEKMQEEGEREKRESEELW